jgi:Protein of unknown function (DUF2795)
VVSDFSGQRIAAAVVGVHFPARNWELLAWADYNGVDSDMRRALWALPAGNYRDLAEVVAAVAATSRRGEPPQS